MENFKTQTIILTAGDAVSKRVEIRDYFLKTWELDERLYSQLKDDSVFYHRGDPLRHIILFYLGHTAVFYINKFFLAKIINKRINPMFESLFAIGVDEMSWDDLNDKNYNWPPVNEVWEYRKEAKELILQVIDTAELSIPITWKCPFWMVMMGIEHERIHIETSSVLIRQLPIDKVVKGLFGEICHADSNVPANDLVFVSASNISLGKHKGHSLYGWDNEYGQTREIVDSFMVSRMLVSNAEYLQFVTDGGYSEKSYWTDEGWAWKSYKNATMPLFWIKDNGKYSLRLVAEIIPMPWSWPVEVNYLEAKAFCNWKTSKIGDKYRLPTEAEWYMLAQGAGAFNADGLSVADANINLSQFSSPCPVNMFAHSELFDVVGNVWQWTESPIAGYPGFEVHPMYDDFSTPTFDGKHNLIKGGSWISTGNEATYHARYAFRRHFYQHAGFRYVQSEIEPDLEVQEYETDLDVANSCEDNWMVDSDFAGMYYGKLVETVNDVCALDSKNVLLLNAQTGRLAFEFAKYAQHVTALDFSARFIRMPILLRDKGMVRYTVKDEGELLFYRDFVLSDEELRRNASKICFMQDNPNNLKPIYTNFDVIVLPLLLEELVDPVNFLENVHLRLVNGGCLVIASTYDWETNGVAREYWPGGYKKDGEPVRSFDSCKSILSTHFESIGQDVELRHLKRLSSVRSVVLNVKLSMYKLVK